jgi:hypothetical protein
MCAVRWRRTWQKWRKNMTNEDAIRALNHIRGAIRNGIQPTKPGRAIEAVDLAIAALERDRWIGVEERFPERNTEVLVYAIGDADGFWGKHVIAIAERFLFKFFPSAKGEEEWSSPWQYFHTDYKITHWKPLPEPPKEE